MYFTAAFYSQWENNSWIVLCKIKIQSSDPCQLRSFACKSYMLYQLGSMTTYFSSPSDLAISQVHVTFPHKSMVHSNIHCSIIFFGRYGLNPGPRCRGILLLTLVLPMLIIPGFLALSTAEFRVIGLTVWSWLVLCTVIRRGRCQTGWVRQRARSRWWSRGGSYIFRLTYILQCSTKIAFWRYLSNQLRLGWVCWMLAMLSC